MIDRLYPNDDDVDERSELECAEARLRRRLKETTANVCFGMAIVFLVNAANGRWGGVVSRMKAEGDSNRKISEALLRLRDAA